MRHMQSYSLIRKLGLCGSNIWLISNDQFRGFTLAELLIGLAILGVIATFTIPKIIAAQQSSANVSKAKEVAAMISGAYQQAQQAGIISSTTKSYDLTPYMNYLSLDTSGTLVDSVPSAASTTCASATPCVKLHNGGVLGFVNSQNFGGTSTLNTIAFVFDPDGNNNTTSTADGPLKAVQFNLYYDGFITTRGQVKAGSLYSGGAFGPSAGYDPSWFSF